MSETIHWQIYRDETKRSLPQKLIDLVQQYKKKLGHSPTIIGLPPSLKGYELLDELEKRFVVEFSVPAWAGNEIWLGSGPPVVPPKSYGFRGTGG